MTPNELLSKADELDRSDPLRELRDKFAIPNSNGREHVYLCGNSLGLAPKRARTILTEEIDAWEARAVEGHFTGERPWLSYHEPLSEPLARLAGAHPDEVVCTGTLTANLQALLASFYRPEGVRRAILIEGDAFPSDRYAATTWIQAHGHSPDKDLLVSEPATNETSETASLIAKIQEHGERIATVFVGGVHYQTGEFLDLKTLADESHKVGAKLVVDLAHAMGNVPLNLHDAGVDGAAWCSYKYLNSGPGAAAGLFIHRDNFNAFRLGGWWGNNPDTRFSMPAEFTPQHGAAGWQWSNAPIFSMAPIYASLEIFESVTPEARLEKSRRLFEFLVWSLKAAQIPGISFLTPLDEHQHGAQLSISLGSDSAKVEQALLKQNITCDHRPPDILRVAPVPLYNSYQDIARFTLALHKILCS